MAKIGIIGYGHVGKVIEKLIPKNNEVVIYDKYNDKYSTKNEINTCEYVFICVPTPLNNETGMLDTREVDEIFSWCTVQNICIKSTVPLGYVLRKSVYVKNLVFSPEYYGETLNHPYANNGGDWLVLGGESQATKIFANLMQEWYPSTTKIHCTDSTTAELAKFMENAYLATKVTFCNTFYDIAQKVGVDYHKLRETWLLDPRIGESHTMVYPNHRGFDGKCLPKDIQSIATQAAKYNCNVDMLQGVIMVNNKWLSERIKE